MFSKKKGMESLKIQDVSADCPSYIEENTTEAEETSKGKKKKKAKKQKKSKMRKIRKKRRNPFVTVFIFLLLVAAGGAGFYFFGIPLLGGSQAVYVERVSNIMGLGSGNGTLNRYAGIVESQGEWTVKVDGDKTVKEIYVSEGDSVEVGDQLFAYDGEEIKLNLEQARLELERMQSEITAAESQIANLESLKEGLSSSEQIDIEIQIQSLKANNKKTEYEIKNQQAAIESLEEASANTTVISELSGVVKHIDNSVMNGGAFGETDFITILATGDYRIKASINEQNQWSIEEGTKVIVRSRVDESVKWTGTIVTIDTQNPEDSDSASYTDTAELTTSSRYPFYVKLDSSKGLILGQHVYVEPDRGQDTLKEGVWLQGYYLIQEEGKTYVWAEGSFKLLEKREVTLGAFNEELGQYEILSGLGKDDYIAFPTDNMREGARTTKESDGNAGNAESNENDNNDFQLGDDSFQEFDGDGNQGNDGDELGPVGSIDMPMEVLV